VWASVAECHPSASIGAVPGDIALLFALEGPITDDVPVIKALIAGLNAERAWAVGPVEFVDDVDLDSAVQADDAPIWTFGGRCLSIARTARQGRSGRSWTAWSS
jgi:hypothetical protein